MVSRPNVLKASQCLYIGLSGANVIREPHLILLFIDCQRKESLCFLIIITVVDLLSCLLSIASMFVV